MFVLRCDVRGDSIDLGHAFYADRDTCLIPFFVEDIFDITLRSFPQVADDVCPSLKEVRSLNELRSGSSTPMRSYSSTSLKNGRKKRSRGAS